MHFIAQYQDRPGSQDARQKFRPAHVSYRMALGEKMVMAGPLLANDGATTIGSFIVFEAPDFAAAQAFAGGDPLVREKAFELVSVTPLRIVAFNPPAKPQG
jgi:uncharacterized protein YciI